MKHYEFKLKGLLRVKEFNEKLIKIEMGKVVGRIEEIKKKIFKCQQDIEAAQVSEEELLKTPTVSNMAAFFPMYIKGKKDEIKLLKHKLNLEMKEYDLTVIQLSKIRGEVKLFEGLKEKGLNEFKRNLVRKEREELEEQINIRYVMSENEKKQD